MGEITKQQARGFLEGVGEGERVGIVCHTDLDGMSSGVLLYNFCKGKNFKVEVIPIELEENAFLKIIKKLKDFDKVLIADIPPFYVAKNLNGLKDKEIFYTDHHKPDTEISEFILEYRTEKEGYIPSSRTCLELTEKENKEKYWLGITGIISDYGWAYKENEKIINDFLEKENISLEEFKQNVVNKIGNFLIYYKKDLKEAFRILKEIDSWKDLSLIEKYAEEVEEEIIKIEKDFYKNKEKFGNINFYYLEPKFSVKPIVVSKIASENPNEVFIFANPTKENSEMISLSARHQSPEADTIKILKESLKGLDNAGAGGHLRACGGFLQKKDLEKFKENLKRYSENI